VSLLIDAYFLRGDYRHIEQTKVLGSLVKRPVSGVDDVLEILGQVYRDANSPFPFIGNIKALSNGLVVPNVGDCFFWFIVSNDSDTIILEDFGSSDKANRISILDQICNSAATQKNSIWTFAESWLRTHHKTSTERLVSYYVHYVKTHFYNDEYRDWLGADGTFVQAPFDISTNKYHYTGIDLRSIDSTSQLRGQLESDVFNSDSAVRISPGEQREIRIFVSEYMVSKRIPLDTVIDNHGLKDVHCVSVSKYEAIRNDILSIYSKKSKALFS
jgi:hypothetical protein